MHGERNRSEGKVRKKQGMGRGMYGRSNKEVKVKVRKNIKGWEGECIIKGIEK